jgi:hypothetical protein
MASLRKDKAQYIEYPVDNNWRFSVIDEPNDIVMRVDFFNTDEKPGAWRHIARIEQSGHPKFHVHLPGSDERINIGKDLSREQKLEIGFEVLRQHAEQGHIKYKAFIFKPSPLWESIKGQILNREIPLGSTTNAKSIGGTARIVGSLDIKHIGKDGKIKAHRVVDENDRESKII